MTEAIERLKSRHPSAMLTIEDLSYVINMVTTEEDEEPEPDDDEVRWADESDSDISYMAETDVIKVERSLSNNAFIHGRTYDKDMDEALTITNGQ